MKRSYKKNIGLDESALLGHLEELARSLGVQVSFELIRKEGSLFPVLRSQFVTDMMIILTRIKEKLWALPGGAPDSMERCHGICLPNSSGCSVTMKDWPV